MADGEPWLVITNPKSGTGDDFDLFAAARYAESRLGRPIQVRMLNRRTNLLRLLRAALRAGYGRIIARGGDGTLRSAAQVLAGTDVPLGVIPGGTFNHFARNMGIPLEPAAAWEIAVAGRLRRVDVAEVNGHVFLNNSSLGLYPILVRRRPKWSGRIGKLLAGAIALAQTLGDYVAARLEIAHDGLVTRERTPAVFVANNRYSGDPMEIWRRPRMDEGVLDVHVIPGNVLRRLVRWLDSFLGRHKPPKLLRDFATAALQIRSRRPRLTVSLDGETMMLPPPLYYRSRPEALSVVVPEEPAG